MIHPRASLNRAAAGIAVAVLVLSLVLTGSGGAAAETPVPKQYGPATPQEIEALEKAAQNVGAPDNPIFEGGYPAFGPEAAAVQSVGAVDASAANWATGPLCSGSEQCLVGDFNGDNKADVAVLYGDSRPEPQRGDVMVATSKGIGFNAVTKWNDLMCLAGQMCKVGDFNADGKDDIVIFNPVQVGFYAAGNVLVALSTGTSFAPPTLWQPLFCVGAQVCAVGNVDGVGGDDIVLFRRSADPGSFTGDVEVALSNSLNGFSSSQRWQDFFCINNEECQVADVNGDGAADIVTFVKTGDGKGRVAVALSYRNGFAGATDWVTWQDGFCVDGEQCALGDFDGDKRADAMKFGSNGARDGNVIVRLSTGASFGSPQTWHGPFCLPGNDCAIGDFNADGKFDISRFVKASSDPAEVGAAYVAIATGTPTGFVPTPPPGGLWQESFCPGSTTCDTGDFNGDGLDDVVYFVRNTQSGVAEGDAYVALSNGASFVLPQKWSDYICSGYYDICKTGDVNGDKKADIIVFSRVQTGPVLVQRSTGSGFGPTEVWNNYFCVGQEWCDVGDYNGDGLTDISLFTRSAYGNTARSGDVEVAISNGSGFIPTGIWHNFFCIGNEWCMSGDVNGDGVDDIIAFSKGSNANVYVELSNRSQFGDKEAPAELWSSFFCAGNEICDVGDFNGDGRDDVITFLRSDYPANPATYGDVYVGLSQGTVYAGGFVSQKWNEYFCILQETCATGFFNNDNKKDVAAFTRGATADVYVALATIGTPFAFVDSTPPLEQWITNLLIRRR